MSQVTTVKAREEFSEVVNRAAYGKERICLTRRGRKIAAIIPMEDVRLLEELEERIDLEDAKEAMRQTKKRGTASWQKLKKELDLD